MKCKLCNKDKKLQKKSHIIPDFMYQDLFDEKHRLHEVQLKPTLPLKNKTKQSGAYEKNILCQSCDNKILGRLETYASQALYGGIDLAIENKVGPSASPYINVKGLDYKKFKLFLLSILWRASISSLPIFQNVELGEHENIIRDRILNNNPGTSSEYSCAIFTYLHHTKIPNQMIVEPGCIIEDSKQIYAFLISGNLFIFFTNTDESTNWVKNCTIKENGAMNIIQMSDKLTSNTINKILGIKLA